MSLGWVSGIELCDGLSLGNIGERMGGLETVSGNVGI